MTVTVTLNDGSDEKFEAKGDEFKERKDGKLEVHREDGTVKVFAANSWSTVDGNKKPMPRASVW